MFVMLGSQPVNAEQLVLRSGPVVRGVGRLFGVEHQDQELARGVVQRAADGPSDRVLRAKYGEALPADRLPFGVRREVRNFATVRSCPGVTSPDRRATCSAGRSYPRPGRN